MLLYRPVGLNELRLMYQANLRAFPPRLPEQPIFYPVLNEAYATKIARDWNTKSESRAGFVTRFAVDDGYASKFERRVVGSREHEELWVPAEDLAEFNGHLEGRIEIIGAHFGEGFVGEDATGQLVALAKMLAHNGSDAAGEVQGNHQAVFLNFFFWEQHDFAAQGVGVVERDALLAFIRESWVQGGQGDIPLGVTKGAGG